MSTEQPVPVPLCRHCKRGTRVDATYTVGRAAIEVPDGYCGWCGRTWPAPARVPPPTDDELSQTFTE